jgi:hypothetical protein
MFNTNVFLDEFVLVGHEAAFSRCFEETYCVHLQGPRGPTSKNFETSETDYSATRRRVPGERNTQAYGRENHDTRTGIWKLRTKINLPAAQFHQEIRSNANSM